MGRCIGEVKKSGIPAKGTGQFSILLGENQSNELQLDTFWTRFQESQDQSDLSIVFAELARRMMKIGPESTAEQLYPYVIPEEYLKHQHTEPRGIVKPLGHRLHVGLVFDLKGLVESLNVDGLRRLGMTPDQAHACAIKNLQALAKAQQIKMAVYPAGPSGKPFVLVGGHWAAATAILLPMVSNNLSKGRLRLMKSSRQFRIVRRCFCSQRRSRPSQSFLRNDQREGGKRPETAHLRVVRAYQ